MPYRNVKRHIETKSLPVIEFEIARSILIRVANNLQFQK